MQFNADRVRDAMIIRIEWMEDDELQRSLDIEQSAPSAPGSIADAYRQIRIDLLQDEIQRRAV